MKTVLIVLFCLIGTALFSQNLTIQEKLGYPKNTKLLIIHADDIGVSHAENAASFKALESGFVNSGSIMVPCPWFPESADYAKNNPTKDLGLHLTLTSEWKLYKWGPVRSKNEVKSLLDKQDYLYETAKGLAQSGTASEVESELRAQIERAKAFGIDATHFDTHMGATLLKPEFLSAYIKLGHEYRTPVLLNKEHLKLIGGYDDLAKYITDKDVVVDNIYMALPNDYKAGMTQYYEQVINNLQPGLHCLLIHTCFDNDEMKAVTMGYSIYHGTWRQADYDFFTSKKCGDLLKKNNIQLVTWREIRDKIVRK
ncbi:ChbG/HpnK family deacetylase [Spirosoma sp. HMF4905]|uniref:ChbG/HpnK family deacetylase n=1 Tax=Spirosoma arboris TaxID=2682092 RepID=A0A7K1S6D4_9BACT|nr:polysaccharide deacetylase family protein [Spirosoma arboris]MVM29206.1 ChbG/HpnK family deacetylase [Spirosoma arboris]